MSRDLPLWNEAETEPLPRFQATYGHVIAGGKLAIAWIEKALDRQVVAAVAASALPALERDSVAGWTFRGEQEAALLYSAEDFSVVYADSAHFMNSTRWIAGSRRLGGELCYGTQVEPVAYNYRVFRKGVLVATRIREGMLVREPRDADVTVSLKGETVARVPAEAADVNMAEYDAWIRQTPWPQQAENFLPDPLPGATIQLLRLKPRTRRWFGW